MKRLALAVAVAALAACAAPPRPAPQPQPAEAPATTLDVVGDYAAETVGTLKSPYLGQPVTLEADRAIDPAGRLCKTPRYWRSEATAAEALEHPPQPQAVHDPAPRTILTVTCDGAAFMTLAALADGGWLTRQGAWVLRLDRQPPPPAAAPQAEVAAAPVPLAPAPAHPETAMPAAHQEQDKPGLAKPELAEADRDRTDPRTLVYLASYKTEAQARAGFKTLAKAAPVLARQKPITQAVDLGKKGKWVRLYGMAADEAQRKALCGQLGKRVDECGARNRE